MQRFDKYLYLKKSKLRGAGKGLFTKRAIPKGARICEYKGKIKTWKQLKYEEGDNPYIFYISSRTVINPLPIRKYKSLAPYANDAKGFTKSKKYTNNAEYIVEGRRCFIDAKRDIQKSEEILVGYGWEYWRDMRRGLGVDHRGRKVRK